MRTPAMILRRLRMKMNGLDPLIPHQNPPRQKFRRGLRLKHIRRCVGFYRIAWECQNTAIANRRRDV